MTLGALELRSLRQLALQGSCGDRLLLRCTIQSRFIEKDCMLSLYQKRFCSALQCSGATMHCTRSVLPDCLTFHHVRSKALCMPDFSIHLILCIKTSDAVLTKLSGSAYCDSQGSRFAFDCALLHSCSVINATGIDMYAVQFFGHLLLAGSKRSKTRSVPRPSNWPISVRHVPTRHAFQAHGFGASM